MAHQQRTPADDQDFRGTGSQSLRGDRSSSTHAKRRWEDAAAEAIAEGMKLRRALLQLAEETQGPSEPKKKKRKKRGFVKTEPQPQPQAQPQGFVKLESAQAAVQQSNPTQASAAPTQTQQAAVPQQSTPSGNPAAAVNPSSDLAGGDLLVVNQNLKEQAGRLMYKRDNGQNLPRIAYHLAILACDRPRWARNLATTILSAYAHGASPATISIIWCKTYDPKAPLPSLFVNTLFSHKIKVLYQLPKYKDGPKLTSAYLRALSVPVYWKHTNLPVVITEDDVVFAPDFNTRIAQIVHKADAFLGGRADYQINLYHPSLPSPVKDVLAQHDVLGDNRAPWGGASEMALYFGIESYYFGTQGILFSPGMARRMAQHFDDVYHERHKIPGLQDMIIHDFLYKRFNCIGMTGPHQIDLTEQNRMAWVDMNGGDSTGAKCISFRVKPSIIQHIGAVSSLFGNDTASNTRYHMAMEFPFKASIAASDPESTW